MSRQNFGIYLRACRLRWTYWKEANCFIRFSSNSPNTWLVELCPVNNHKGLDPSGQKKTEYRVVEQQELPKVISGSCLRMLKKVNKAFNLILTDDGQLLK